LKHAEVEYPKVVSRRGSSDQEFRWEHRPPA